MNVISFNLKFQNTIVLTGKLYAVACGFIYFILTMLDIELMGEIEFYTVQQPQSFLH